jgi:single-strand DNA-binding protein
MNKWIGLGRLTKEPDLKYSNNNVAICKFTIAIDRKYTKQGEEKQTDFIPIVTFNKLAEFCRKYFMKGRQVVIVGKMQNRTWDDNEGKRHYITEIIGDECYFADSKLSNSSNNNNANESVGNTNNIEIDESDLPF